MFLTVSNIEFTSVLVLLMCSVTKHFQIHENSSGDKTTFVMKLIKKSEENLNVDVYNERRMKGAYTCCIQIFHIYDVCSLWIKPYCSWILDWSVNCVIIKWYHRVSYLNIRVYKRHLQNDTRKKRMLVGERRGMPIK